MRSTGRRQARVSSCTRSLGRKCPPDSTMAATARMPRVDGFGVMDAMGDEMPLTIFCTAYDEHALAAFEARAVAEPGVQQCHRVSSGPDLMLLLQVEDMAAYHALVQRLFTQDANVRNVKTFFSVHRAKFDPSIRLPPLTA